jgi:DNA-binding response OmpR family regulator
LRCLKLPLHGSSSWTTSLRTFVLLKAVLVPHDYDVISAYDGVSALALAESERPDLVLLLDVMLPDLDGYTVCARLRARENHTAPAR